MNFRDMTLRRYAHPFDRPVKTLWDRETHGVGRDSDAIGGYMGVGWYASFRDRNTDELYRVHCSDGVNGGKDPHTDTDTQWMDSCRRDIIARTKHAADQMGTLMVRISKEEWAIMLNFVFEIWLDPKPGEKYQTVGDDNRHLDHGQIGTINGIPIKVDPSLECPLSTPPSDQMRMLQQIFDRIDTDEDKAEAFGY